MAQGRFQDMSARRFSCFPENPSWKPKDFHKIAEDRPNVAPRNPWMGLKGTKVTPKSPTCPQEASG